MKTCKDCQHFKDLISSEVGICKEGTFCLAIHPICNNFKEMQTKTNLNYLYVGFLKSCELGLVEIEQNKETNYRRIEMGPEDWYLLNEDNMANASSVQFPIALKTWGAITYFGIFDSAQNGNLLTIGIINQGKGVSIFKDQIIVFEISDLQIKLEDLKIYNNQ